MLATSATAFIRHVAKKTKHRHAVPQIHSDIEKTVLFTLQWKRLGTEKSFQVPRGRNFENVLQTMEKDAENWVKAFDCTARER